MNMILALICTNSLLAVCTGGHTWAGNLRPEYREATLPVAGCGTQSLHFQVPTFTLAHATATTNLQRVQQPEQHLSQVGPLEGGRDEDCVQVPKPLRLTQRVMHVPGHSQHTGHM